MSAPARPLLCPLVPAYRLALALRELRLRCGLEAVRRLGKPVVSIGSLSAGGAGKTPLTIALTHALTRRGIQVDVLSRGYGRLSQAVARVSPQGAAVDFGDEPLLIARQTGVPVYVARQRYQAGLLAESDAAPALHLLDDGFQHRQLRRDANILLLDRNDMRDHLLPAGNLREPLSAMRRATIVAIPSEGAPELESVLRARGWSGPVWRLRRRMETPQIPGSVVAFCGIARPQQFFSGLENCGLHLTARIAFPDHHPYTARDLKRVQSAARSTGAAAAITTEKDSVRLGALAEAFPESLPLHTVKLRIEIENEDAVLGALTALL
jgi:tetraacyldisaccharide 4'-kinase